MLPPSMLNPSIPHPSTIPKHLHLPSMFHPQNPPVDSPPVHNSTLNTPPYAPNPTTPPALRLTAHPSTTQLSTHPPMLQIQLLTHLFALFRHLRC
ncbi:unnamed protein product [Brassica oleracea]